jgi:hypothetical protein
VNPDNKLGLHEIEYVGHVLNSKGKYFSKEKINKLLELQRPIHKGGLKQFLGLVNYFRDHVNNLAILTHPLEALLTGYTKSTSTAPIPWTSDTINAYEQVLLAIKNLPMLYYMIPGAPIFLETDASDYGIGAYLYQIDSMHQPIAFVSKALSGPQLNWPADV